MLCRNFLSDGAPALLILQQLKRAGWAAGPEPSEHTVGEASPKFGSSHFARRRYYLQCLLSLAELCKRGLETLSVGRSATYYKCLLHSATPATVPFQAGTSAYSKLLRQGGEGGVVSLPSLPSVPVEAPHESDGEEQSSSSEDDIAVAPSSAPVPEVPSRASSPPSEPMSEEEPVCSGVQTPMMAALDPALAFDEFGVFGEPGYYRRWKIQCPLRRCKHFKPGKLCQRSRNVGAAQCAHFGQLEPQAYLLAWAAKAANFNNRRKHMKYTPTVSDIRSVLESRGLLS